MTPYDIKAPRHTFDRELIRELVEEFDLSKPLLGQIEALITGHLAAISLQWSQNGLNVYPIGHDGMGEFHGWAFHCKWAHLREEIYVFMSGYAQQDGKAFDSDGMAEITKLRDEIKKLVKILDAEIAAGKPSAKTMKRF